MSEEHRLALPQGTRIRGFEFHRVLGQGGFGITYLGWNLALDIPVAIKEYLPGDLATRESDLSVVPQSSQAASDFQWGLERFLDEARTLARFQHTQIVRVHQYFEAHGTAYIAMDYVEGEDLSEYLTRKGTLSESELKAILYPLLSALEVIHGANFLHRDIKPGNIVLRDADGSPVLLDFGAARQAIGAKSRSVTSIVTPGYAPIEQYSSRGRQGPWTDIYALGGVCYRALTGQVPDDATDRVRNDPLISAAERGAGQASPEFLAGIDAALSVDEEDRPQSVSIWRAALEVYTPKPEKDLAEAEQDEMDDATIVIDTEAIPSKRQKRSNLKLFTMVLGVVVLLVGLGRYVDHVKQGQEQAALKMQREEQAAALEEKKRQEQAALEKKRQEQAALEMQREEKEQAAALEEKKRQEQAALEKKRQERGELEERKRQEQAALKERRRREQAALKKQRQEQAALKEEQRKRARGFLGVVGNDLEPTLAKALGLGDFQGILISRVRLGGAADNAGIKNGDVILEMGGKPLKNLDDFRTRIGSVAPGVEVELLVLRDNKRKHVRVELGSTQATLGLGMRKAKSSAESGHRKEPRPGQRFRDCSVCPEMVVIPLGSFTMGSPASERGSKETEKPRHQVTITNPLAVGVFEVMFEEWDACVRAGGCNGFRPSDENWGRGNRPVINVSWNDTQTYLQWLSERTGNHYRLLSESEWEYVARAGTKTPFHFGKNISTHQANFQGHLSRGKTMPVGTFPRNRFGLYDIHGNVLEWTKDCWNSSYHGASSNGSALEHGDCRFRVVRGGSWKTKSVSLRSANRGRITSGVRHYGVGFRVARNF